jgi:hypothetical protein
VQIAARELLGEARDRDQGVVARPGLRSNELSAVSLLYQLKASALPATVKNRFEKWFAI